MLLISIKNILYSCLVSVTGVLCMDNCDIPKDVAYKFVELNKNESMISYRVWCNQNLTLDPVRQNSTVNCSDGNWSSKYYPAVKLNDLKCVKNCEMPKVIHGNFKIPPTFGVLTDGEVFASQPGYVRPGMSVWLYCDEGYYLKGTNATVCSTEGQWIPPIPTCNSLKDPHQSNNGSNPELIAIIVSVCVLIPLSMFMIGLALFKARRCSGVCRKRRVPVSSHPDDRDYPHGYTQLGSGPILPSYEEAVQTANRETGPFTGVHRLTNAADYHQLSSMESSSRGESDSVSNGTHRHSLFSGSSGQFRDTLSDIILGDGVSMSDTSTLVTVNTYESHTASNPSLSNSRRGVAGSVNTDSMDDTPLIHASSRHDVDIEETEQHDVVSS